MAIKFSEDLVPLMDLKAGHEVSLDEARVRLRTIGLVYR